MEKKENAPTLLIGIGGIGAKAVDLIRQRIQQEQKNDLRLIAIDTDETEKEAEGGREDGDLS